MKAYKNPEMQEILEGFCEESTDLIQELEDILEEHEENIKETELLEKFGQVIDRMMGAAKSLQIDEMASLCELGKVVGYKSSQVSDEALLEIVSAVLFDSVEILDKMNKSLEKKDFDGYEKIDSSSLNSRMSWLSEKFKNIDRSSCSTGQTMEQDEIDKLINGLGIK